MSNQKRTARGHTTVVLRTHMRFQRARFVGKASGQGVRADEVLGHLDGVTAGPVVEAEKAAYEMADFLSRAKADEVVVDTAIEEPKAFRAEIRRTVNLPRVPKKLARRNAKENLWNYLESVRIDFDS